MAVFHKAVEQAWDAADAQALQPPSRVLVLLSVARYVNGNAAFPSYATLAEHAHMSAVQVKAHIHALVEGGWLSQTRRKPTTPGWGAPQWTLGPRCQGQTSGTPDIRPARHLVRQTQTSGTPDIQTSGVPAQKRESPTTTVAVVQSNGGGKSGSVVKRTTEERGPPTPQPVKATGHPRIQAFFDGLRGGDGKQAIEGTLTAQDLRFIKEGDFDPADLGACYRATVDGTWAGADEWIKARLSLGNVHRYRYPRWATRGTPVAARPSNGAPDRVASMRALMDKVRVKEKPADDVRRVRPALRAPADPL